MRLLYVLYMAFTNHTHPHTLNIHSRHVPAHAHTKTHTHTAGTHTRHTLTTYCLASKAYVGRPRVLFISSLWQMSERGDCCCGGCQRKYSFVNENSENSTDVFKALILYTLLIWLPKHRLFLFSSSRTQTRAHTLCYCGWIRQLICTTQRLSCRGRHPSTAQRDTTPHLHWHNFTNP